MTENSEIPPAGSERLVFKEPEPVQSPVEKIETKKIIWGRWQVVLLFLLTLIIINVIIIASRINANKKKIVVITPSPSLVPSPSATSSATLKQEDLETQINDFQKKLQTVDLKENELTPPSLDFNIHFEVK